MKAVDAAQADPDAICAGIGFFDPSAESLFSTSDYLNVLNAGRELRRAGYKAQAMYSELRPIAAIRSQSEQEAAILMYKGWDSHMFSVYIALIGENNGCTFR